MANILKRVSLTTDRTNPYDLLKDGLPKPTIKIEKIGNNDKVTITFFIDASDVEDIKSMTAEEIVDAGTKFVDLKPDADNNVFSGGFSVSVNKNASENAVLTLGALLTTKPPHGALS